jgi:SNF2 family DNA or RNA helicase
MALKLFSKTNSSEGYVRLQSGQLKIAIKYCKDRVSLLKSIPGSSITKGSRVWSIDPKYYELLDKSGLFPEEKYPRDFNPKSISVEQAPTDLNIEHEAKQAYKKNPLSLNIRYIKFLALDVFFSFSIDKSAILARVDIDSATAKFLLKSKHAIQTRNHSDFLVCTECLPTLLSGLRDKKFRLGVEENLSKYLSETSSLRKKLISNNKNGSLEDFKKCLLRPVIDFVSDQEGARFVSLLHDDVHLTYLFSEDKSWTAAKKSSMSLTVPHVLEVLAKEYSVSMPIYLTAIAKAKLEEYGYKPKARAGLTKISSEEPPSDTSKLEVAWICYPDGRAGLLLDKKLLSTHKIESAIKHAMGHRIFFIQPKFSLLSFYRNYKQKFKAYESQAFKDLIKELEQRQELIDYNQKFKKNLRHKLVAETFSNSQLLKILFPHQRSAVEWLRSKPHALLGDDMGLGKTLSVLASIDSLILDKEINFSLIICPNSLSRNWLAEAQTFTPLRRYEIIPESPKDRARLFRQIESGIVVCDGVVLNYEKLRSPDVLKGLLDLLKDKQALLCFDESQRIKNPKSVAFQALRKLGPLFKRRIALSGTPTPRDITDVWSQVTVLDGGERFGNSYYKWLKEIAELGTKYSEYAVRSFKPFAVENTIARVHELLLRRRKEEVVNLPEKTFVNRFCQMQGDQAKRYTQLCKELLLQMRSAAGKDFVRVVDNMLEEYLRAVQLASNPRLIDPGFEGDPAKFKELDEIVNEVVVEKREKIVIWTNFLGNVAELTKRYQQHGCYAFSGEVPARIRNKTVKEFQTNTEGRVLVAVPAAGGVGITLTAAKTAVYIDRTWNAEHWLQSVDRIHRIGQNGTVNIITLSACKVDELIAKNLKRKSHALKKLLGDYDAQEFDDKLRPDYEEMLEAVS